jgi:hypothetical protein
MKGHANPDEGTSKETDRLSAGLSCDACLHKPVCKVLPDVKKVIDDSNVVEKTVAKSWTLASWLGIVMANHCQYYK